MIGFVNDRTEQEQFLFERIVRVHISSNVTNRLRILVLFHSFSFVLVDASLISPSTIS